ncbi:MAG: hypothetical protein M3R27_08500 [Bacteroidota bacterium]|nr:hypothetical protein [Bacteroidota bacterium]
MSVKRRWLITSLLLAIHIVVQYVFYFRSDLESGIGIISFLVDLASNLFLLAVVAGLLATLLSFIPYKDRMFSDKLARLFPVGISVILLILIAAYVYGIVLINSN